MSDAAAVGFRFDQRWLTAAFLLSLRLGPLFVLAPVFGVANFPVRVRVLMAFALAGSGIALLPEWLVAAALADGALAKVMPEFSFPPQGVYAVYPDAQHIPARVRAFIDFLRERVG